MRKYENHCVGCPEGMGCLGSSCPYRNVPVDYCDICGSEGAEYRIDGEDYCEDCAEEYLKDTFLNSNIKISCLRWKNDLTISEKAEALEVDLEKIDD